MKQRGFTLIELLVYMGIFSILLVVLTEMLVSILNLQLDSTATSSVDQDNRFIQQRLTYDIQRAKSFTVSPDQKTLTLSIGTSTYTYSALSNSLQLNGLPLNSFDTTITNLLFQKVGTTSTAIMINYGVISSVSKASGPEIHNTNTLIALRPNTSAVNPTSPPAPTITPIATLTPTSGPISSPTPTPASCSVTTNPSSLNLSINGNSNITASVTFGLGNASVSRMNFGSYNTSVATVNPTSDNRSPYTTTVTAVSSGSAAVWATATLSDGRTCQTTGNSDTNVTVLAPPTNTPTPTPRPTNTPTRIPTPTPTPANCSAYCNQQYGNGGSCQRSSQCGRNQHNSGSIYGCTGNNICCCN